MQPCSDNPVRHEFLNENTMNQMSFHRQTKQQRQVAVMSACAKFAPTSAYWSSLFISVNDRNGNPIEGYTGSLEGDGKA